MAKDRADSKGIQSNDENAKVVVNVGYHCQTGETITEFIVADKGDREHHHIGINERGDEVFHSVKDD